MGKYLHIYAHILWKGLVLNDIKCTRPFNFFIISGKVFISINVKVRPHFPAEFKIQKRGTRILGPLNNFFK